MKTCIVWIGLLILSSNIQAQVLSDIDKMALSESRNYKNQALANSGAAEDYGYEVFYHQLYVEIDPAIRRISGSVFTQLKKTTDVDTMIYFDCSSALIVDSVKRALTPLVFHQQFNDILAIDLNNDLNAGSSDSFTIYYHGIPSSTGFGSFMQTFHDSVPNIWTLSQPYGAKDWWPCKQTLSDKIDSIDIYIQIPTGNLAASNGLLVDIDSTADRPVFHWKHRYPIATYLIAISVTNYTAISLSIDFDNDTLQYLNYVYPEDYVEALDGCLSNIQVMHLFDSLFTPYPFLNEKYGHAQFGWGGGMEHQTMSFVGSFNFELLAHELAHQWFGDKITCGSWQDIWLNEGFATYLSGLCYEHLLNGFYWPIFKKQSIEKVCRETGGSVYIPAEDTLNVPRIFSSRLSYVKGAMVLHMLRWKIGDDAFYRGLNSYLLNSRLAYSFSRSEDFITEMQLASGQDLQEFFNDWLYGEGYPTYNVSWRQQVDDNRTTIKIDQYSSSAAVDFFEMPIAIKFFNASNEQTVVLDHQQNHQFFTIDLPFKADSAQLDPDLWLVQKGSNIINISEDLKKDNLSIQLTSNIISNQVELSISSEKNEKIELFIVNSLGQRIVQESFEVSFGKTNKNYLLNNVAKGYYYLYIKAGKESHSYKLLKT